MNRPQQPETFASVVKLRWDEHQDQEMQRGERQGSNPPFSLATVTDANALRSPVVPDSNVGTSP
jgi:hypothetical protein